MTLALKKQISYWKSESTRSFEIAQLLFKKKKRPEALFFGHLAVEKILKALVVHSTHELAPLIHDLNRLAQLAHLTLTHTQQQELQMITSFNIAGRYDNDKIEFRKQCTPTFTKNQMNIIKQYYLWLNQELSQAK